MSEEGSTQVHLSHTTSIDTIWDFEIQGIDNEGPLPLNEEQSDNDQSLSVSALSTVPSGLLIPSLDTNPADRSSSGGDWRIYERRRKVRKSRVYPQKIIGCFKLSSSRVRPNCHGKEVWVGPTKAAKGCGWIGLGKEQYLSPAGNAPWGVTRPRVALSSWRWLCRLSVLLSTKLCLWLEIEFVV